MEKKYLNGNLTRDLAFGLSWIPTLGWILALVMLILDKDALAYEDKEEIIEVFTATILGGVLSFTFVAPAYVVVCSIIKCIMTLTGKSFAIPGVHQLAKIIASKIFAA